MGRFPLPLLCFALVVSVIYSVFLGIIWVINGFAGKNLLLSRRKFTYTNLIFFCLFPVMASGTCFLIEYIKIQELKMQNENWKQHWTLLEEEEVHELSPYYKQMKEDERTKSIGRKVQIEK